MSASSTAALPLLNKGKREEREKFRATAENDEMTLGISKPRSHAHAGANSRRGGTPAPRGGAIADTNIKETSSSVPAPSAPNSSPSMLLNNASPVPSSSKLTLDASTKPSALPHENPSKPPYAPTTLPIPLPVTPIRKSNLSAKGKGKEQYMHTTPPQERPSTTSPIPTSHLTHRTSPSTTVPTTPKTAANDHPSDAETEVADDALSNAATEIVPFLPKLPRRLNLPPRRIPTPPLPAVKSIDFAYRPKPSLAGLPYRPVDPRWVVPRVPLPPGCDKVPGIPGAKERWIQEWEAKQDKPGGIYRTGRNRADGKPNPPPFISAIVTAEGVRGYTSQGWVSPSMKKPKPEEDRWRSSGGRHRHRKSKARGETSRPEGRKSNDTAGGLASVKRSPAPLLSQPVPRRALPAPPALSRGPVVTSTADQEVNPLSPGRKRRHADTELETDDGDEIRHSNTNLKHDNPGEQMEVDTVPPTTTNTRARTKAKLDVDAGSSTKPTVKTTSKRKTKSNGHPPESEPVEVPPNVASVASPTPRYSLRSHRNGKGRS
ncbi:hypothetical protein Clacol_001323 [Clathrus columnatus]|uniref:Nuclear protein MDM1 n=1 Tax=Clathrus columnatus TaxID=1419009 RepID=A0AAV5A3B3_9AGAM|nr:hypothetical protein Clacol_001323 [Clathrus columnatus]